MIEVAVVGATGLVGLEIQSILSENRFEGKIKCVLFASQSSSDGRILGLSSHAERLKSCPYILNGATSEVAQFLANNLQPGQTLIDNSSQFRMDPSVPLVVPEINGELLKARPPIVANPNCTAILLCLTLAPFKEVGLARVVVSTYQAASGAGIKALEELEGQFKAIGLGQKIPDPQVFSFPLATNLFSHNSTIRTEDVIGSGYNDEEWKVVEETRKILDIRHLLISATCVRVPVRRAHTESVTVDFKSDISLEELRERLSQAPGVRRVDDWEKNHFPMPLEAEFKNEVLVGRIRKDVSLGKTAHWMLAGDQIRKGAALNAVQIMESMMVSESH
jgi:aspartate-semialdehyde dehydrogenase